MEVVYTTQETAELAPMDPVAEAPTLAAQFDALETEHEELLLEHGALERELNKEMAEHAETASRLNQVERALLDLFKLGFDGPPPEITVELIERALPKGATGATVGVISGIDFDQLLEALKTAQARMAAGKAREATRSRKEENEPGVLEAQAAASHVAYLENK